MKNKGEQWWEISYEEWKNLPEEKKYRIQIKSANDWLTWQELAKRRKLSPKNLFPSSWTYEEIAGAMKKAEELIKSGNNGKLVKKLDEETFIEYLQEWWKWNMLSKESKNDLLNKFRNGKIEVIEFWMFGSKFERNVMEYNELNIKIWGKYEYVDEEYMLSEEIRTLYPDR